VTTVPLTREQIAILFDKNPATFVTLEPGITWLFKLKGVFEIYKIKVTDVNTDYIDDLTVVVYYPDKTTDTFTEQPAVVSDEIKWFSITNTGPTAVNVSEIFLETMQNVQLSKDVIVVETVYTEANPLSVEQHQTLVAEDFELSECTLDSDPLTAAQLARLFDKHVAIGDPVVVPAQSTLNLKLKTATRLRTIESLGLHSYYVENGTGKLNTIVYRPDATAISSEVQPFMINEEVIEIILNNASQQDNINVRQIVAKKYFDVNAGTYGFDPLTVSTQHIPQPITAIRSDRVLLPSADRPSVWALLEATKMFAESEDCFFIPPSDLHLLTMTFKEQKKALDIHEIQANTYTHKFVHFNHEVNLFYPPDDTYAIVIEGSELVIHNDNANNELAITVFFPVTGHVIKYTTVGKALPTLGGRVTSCTPFSKEVLVGCGGEPVAMSVAGSHDNTVFVKLNYRFVKKTPCPTLQEFVGFTEKPSAWEFMAFTQAPTIPPIVWFTERPYSSEFMAFVEKPYEPEFMAFVERTSHGIEYVGFTERPTPLPPADYFVFDPIDSQTEGEPFDITIRAMDPLGNPDPLYNGTAVITDTTGTISPVTGDFVAGVCIIEVTIEDAQSGEVITATDGAITGDSDPFEVEEMLYAELEVKGAMLGAERTRQTYDLAALGHGPAAPTEGAFGSAVCPLGTFAGSHFLCDTRGYLYVTDKTTGVVTQYDIWTLLSQNFDPYDICFKGNPDTTGFIVIVGRNETTSLPSVVIATVESGVLVFYGPYDQTAVGLGYFLGCADNIGDDNFFVTESGNGPGATPGSVHVLKITATNNPAPPPRYSLIRVIEDTGSPFQTAGTDLFNPCDIACDAADHAWFIDTLAGPPHRLNEIAYAGAGTTVTEHAVLASIFSPYTTSGTGRAPSRLVVDATGNVWITGYNPGPNRPVTIEYVLATGNFAIQEWSTFTSNTTFAGIAIGANGHLYMMVYTASGTRYVMELDNNWQWYYNIHAWVPNAYAFPAPYTGYPLYFTYPKDNPIDPVTNDMWIGDGNAATPAIVTRMHLTDPYQDIAVPTLGTAIEVREITIISSISADVFVGFVSLGRIGECVAGKATHIKTSKTGAVNEHLGVFSNTAGANVLTEFVIRVIVGYKEV